MDLNALRKLWSTSGVTIRPGARPAQLTALIARCSRFPIPAALLEYFESVDGMDEAVMGPELTRFWTLEETLASARESEDRESLYLDFADYSISAVVFTLRLSRTGDQVVYQGSRGDEVAAASFEEFIARYVADPLSIL